MPNIVTHYLLDLNNIFNYLIVSMQNTLISQFFKVKILAVKDRQANVPAGSVLYACVKHKNS